MSWLLVLACVLGVVSSQSQSTCGKEAYLLVADHSSIKRISLDGQNSIPLVSNIQGCQALDSDIEKDYIFYSNFDHGGIRCLHGSQNLQVISAIDSPQPNGLSLDKIHKRLYWSDQILAKIRASNYDGTGIVEIVSTGLTKPRGVAVDASLNCLYWSDWGTNKIEKSYLNGTGRVTIVGSGLTTPSDIAIDAFARKVYWSDVGLNKIERANLDGSGRELLVRSLNYPYGIALHEKYIYWSDSAEKKIQRASKINGVGIEDVVTGLTTPYQIRIVPGAAFRDVVSCGPPLTITCPANLMIGIVSAFYGRTVDGLCPDGSAGNYDCSYSGATATVKSVCNGKQSCTIVPGSHFPIDPCPGTSKYIRVKYDCCTSLDDGSGSVGECTKEEVEVMPALGNCVSRFPFRVGRCNGGCTSRSFYDFTKNDVTKECTCCVPVDPRIVRTTMHCLNGAQIDVQYTDFTACRCRPCSSLDEPNIVCKRESHLVRPILGGQCIVANDIDVGQCNGGCPSTATYAFGNNILNKECQCCEPSKSEQVTRQVPCVNGGTRYVQYTSILDCVCKECASNEE